MSMIKEITQELNEYDTLLDNIEKECEEILKEQAENTTIVGKQLLEMFYDDRQFPNNNSIDATGLTPGVQQSSPPVIRDKQVSKNPVHFILDDNMRIKNVSKNQPRREDGYINVEVENIIKLKKMLEGPLKRPELAAKLKKNNVWMLRKDIKFNF
jgi:hypothetical protein